MERVRSLSFLFSTIFTLAYSFLPDLRQASVEKSGDMDFWLRVRDLGRAISLISSSEASSLGGKSDISETKAAEVRSHAAWF